MTFDQLRTFLTAAETLNFTRAARTLHLSQPAVSQQMRELEDRLELTLFERQGRSLALTPAGERLRMLAMGILQGVQRAEDELMEFREVPQGVLQLGADHTLGTYLLPHALGAFSRHYPGVRVSLRVSNTESVMRALNEGELDLVLLEDAPARVYGWERQELVRDELVLIAPPDHPWSRQSEVALESLLAEQFILRQPEAPIRRLHGDRLTEAGLDPDRLKVRFELGSTEGLKQAVMAGLGVGFASRYAVATEVLAGALSEVRIREVPIMRSLWLLKPTRRALAVYPSRFLELLLGLQWLPATLKDRVPC